MLTDTSVDSD